MSTMKNAIINSSTSMDQHVLGLAQPISRLLGWIYALSWSASFYPQPLQNWRRKNTYGLSIDFCFLNVVGFTCYTTSIACLLYSPVIRSQYAWRHPDAPLPTVRFNDMAYAVHALLMVSLTYTQLFPLIWGFEVSRHQRISWPIAVIVCVCFSGVAVTILLVLFYNGLSDQDCSRWAWIDAINAIGYVKLTVTFVKYVPQVWLNYLRKSTNGWHIGQILFDVLGGVLSMLQLGIDASMQHSWKDAIDNPVKLGLGYVSIFFDLIFITQHYLLYPEKKANTTGNDDGSVHQPLLNTSST